MLLPGSKVRAAREPGVKGEISGWKMCLSQVQHMKMSGRVWAGVGSRTVCEMPGEVLSVRTGG